ncbi:hypothetical protein [uncultured Thiodictyon sp.]|nr:hypothetical protein [uncultured Thiodictyon sp.]
MDAVLNESESFLNDPHALLAEIAGVSVNLPVATVADRSRPQAGPML